MDTVKKTLGFYFLIFLPDVMKKRVKVWIDGDENYRFYSFEEFISLSPENERFQIRKALMETSMFIWDVKKKEVRRLNASYEKKPLMDWIKNKVTEEEAPEKEEHKYWRSNFSEDCVTIKK